MRKTFRARQWLAALLSLALVVSLAPAAAAAVTGITLSKSNLNLEVGGATQQLTATLTGGDGSETVTWNSDNSTVASVTPNGTTTTVTPNNTGTATITASVGSVSATCQVTVVAPTLTLSQSRLSLKIGGTSTLTARLSNGTKPPMTWKSSKWDAVKVDNGTVKVNGYSKDPVTITASCTVGGETLTASCEVTVNAPTMTIDPVPPLSVSVGGAPKRVKVTIPKDDVVTGWVWDAEGVGNAATVDQKITGPLGDEFVFNVSASQRDEGITNYVKITYGPSGGSGIEELYRLTIAEPVVRLNHTKLEVPIGGDVSLQAELDGNVMGVGTWEFVITPKDLFDNIVEDAKYGTLTMTAKQNNTARVVVNYKVDGKVAASAECEITVKPYEAPQIAPIQNIEMVEGDTVDVTAALTPANMKGTWAWTVASAGVDPDKGGKVVIDGKDSEQTVKLKAGTLEGQSTSAAQTVTVKFTSDTEPPAGMGFSKEATQTFNVTVKQADRKVEIDPAEKELNILQDSEMTVKVTVTKGGIALLDSAQNKTITYDTEIKDNLGRKIAEVSGPTDLTNGVANLTIKPLGTGEGTLTVTHTYGGNLGIQTTRQGTFKLKVTGPSIKLDKTSMNLDLVSEKSGELTATLEPSGTLANVKWEVRRPLAADKNKPSTLTSDVVSITRDRTGHCLVRAEKNGRAFIIATYELAGDASGLITAQCVVEVGEYHFSITPDTNQLKEPGEKVSITASVRKSDGSDVMGVQEQFITWQLSDGTIARFSEAAPGTLEVNGKRSVTVLSKGNNATGTVTVIARWKYATYDEERSIDITFAAPEAESFSFTLPRSTVSGKTGGDLTQTPTTGAIKWNTGKTYPVPGDFKPTYTYQSSDTTVAKVEQGKVVGVGAGEATITVSGSATANGKAITAEPKTYKVVVSADLSVKSIKLSATSLSLDVGGRQTVTATTDPAGAVVVWSSSDEKVATVNAGTIVAVGPGSATITAAAGGQTAQVQVTVNGLEQLLDEITVTEGKTVSVDTIFKAHGAAAGKNPTYSSLDPTVASYANGSIVGNKVGNTSITIASGSYRISVKVTVVADSTSIIDLPTLYTQSQPVLRFRDFIARFRPQAGGNLSHIVGLNLDTSKGTLYYNYTSANEPGAGVGADSYYLSPAAGQRGIEDITFVPKAGYSGRVTINYTAVSTGGQNFVCSIVFDVDPGTGTGSGLNLSTPYNTPLRFSGAEFNRVCQDRLGVRLDYVTFSQPSGQQGTLYTNYVSAGNYGKVVSGNDQYTTKALDDVWFVPAPGFSGSVTVYYTAYGVGGASYSGQASIAVGWENNVAIGGLTYDINRGGVAYFDDFRFSSYCRQVLDSSKNLSHIRFSSLPASNEGVLYYNYNSSSRTQASTGTNYYYNSSSPYIDRLAFAAASGFTGTVKIPFTGWTTDGVSFTGNVEVNVQGGGTEGSAGDILYICGAGQTVSFDDSDFNALSRTRTGSSLNYITLESLPGSASGSVYYNNSRASTGTNYRNGSSTPRIDNLSFRASGSFYGAVDIPFTGRATNGDTFRGVITVASSSSAVGSGSGNASQTVFTDMAGYSAAQQAAVNYLYDHNITRGMTTTQYGPQSSIRRGDFARMVYLAFDLTPSASSRPFQDVPSTAYYAQAVNALYSRGIVSGIGGGLYDPNGTLTRQDAICIVQRAMRAVGWSADDGSVSSLYRYSDGGSVSGYAQGAMAFAVERGILPTGGSWLNPTQPLSRVDMAEVLYRVLANSGY